MKNLNIHILSVALLLFSAGFGLTSCGTPEGVETLPDGIVVHLTPAAENATRQVRRSSASAAVTR